MRSKAFLLLLLPCTLCVGQSVLTTPAELTQPIQSSSLGQTPSTGLTQGSSQVSGQPGEKTYLNTFTPGAGPLAGQVMPQAPTQSRVVGPLTQKSDFEKFAEDSTGYRLPVYGRKLFDEVPTTFAPVEHIPVPADYVLGPGDQLLIRAWGKIDIDARVTVDRNGQIYLPKVGSLTVAGLRYEQVEGFLHSSIGALFKDFQLNVTLGQLRSIQIFVLGNARQPGGYTISSLSTLVDALFATGGPSATGTMRHIQLLRGGQTVADFDLYDLIQKGDKSHDARLLPGDVIYIPPVGAQVAISGDVNEPGIYELKGETTVGDALKGAGGVTSLANTERVLLERIEDHSSREVEEFSLDASGQGRLLRDGDLLQVFPISPRFKNAVTLRGNVAQPGLYPWKQGMRISDLIPSRDFLVTRNYWNSENHLVPPISTHPFGDPRANRFGNSQTDQFGSTQTDQSGISHTSERGNQSEDRYGNQRADQSGNAQTDQSGEAQTDQSGEAQTDQSGMLYANQPGDQGTDQYGNSRSDQLGNPQTDHAETLRTDQHRDQGRGQFTNSRIPIIDTVGQNNAEINWEYALIERLDEKDLSTRLIPFRLASAIDDTTSADNRLLKPGDVVTIFSSADLALPMAKHSLFVRVGGEVNAPGVYQMNPGDTLRDVVQKAGGLTPHSYLYASIFTRVSTRIAQEKELKQSLEQMQRELFSKYANSTPTTGQTATDQQAQLGMQQTAIAKISAIQPTGRVVLEMKPEAAGVEDIPKFPLEDGDAFYIPPQPDTVQVSGSVYNVNAFRFEPRKRLIAYLNAAGGPTREADGKRIFVIRADGTVLSRQSRNSHTHGNFEKLAMFPGDTIVVPEKFKSSNGLQNFANYAQIISGFAMTGAVLGTILP